MKNGNYFTVKCLIFIFSNLYCTFIVSYFITDWEIANDLHYVLSDLHKSIQMNQLILKKIQDVDVSYLMHQYDICRIKIRYGLSYEQSTLLYKYHLFHNVKVGSITNLIEYDHLVEKQVENYDLPKGWSDLTNSQKQTAHIVVLVFLSYWLIILIGTSLPLPKH